MDAAGPGPTSPDRRRVLALLGGLAAGVALAGCSDDDGSGDDARRSTTTGAGPSPTTAVGAVEDAHLTAFFAGVPLVTTFRTMQTFAPITVINRAFASPGLTNASTRLVVAPNHDTVYVLAVLDLHDGPVRIDLPAIADRYHVIQVLDAWMGSVALLGTRATGGRAGSWVVKGPGDDAPAPAGLEVLSCPSRHAFVLGRIRAVDDADAAAAVAVARTVAIAPLTATGRAPDALGAPAGPPQDVGGNGAAFFDELNEILAVDQPVTDAQRAAFAAADDVVRSGLRPSTDVDLRDELARAVGDGLDQLAEGARGAGRQVNGWRVNLDLGRADDRQPLRDRAVIARYFWGPVPAEEAVYPKAEVASDGEPLTGDKRYRVTLAGDDLPPVDAFWSLTVYDEDLFFYDNPQRRYSLSGDLPGLRRDADGTVRVLLQHDEPEDPAANWIPTPAGPFHLIMRLYLPRRAVVDGSWDPPPVEVVT